MRVAHRLITINKNCIVQSSCFATSACSRWPRASKDDRTGLEKWKKYLDSDKADISEQTDDVVAETNFGTIRLDSMNVRNGSPQSSAANVAYTYSAKAATPPNQPNQEAR